MGRGDLGGTREAKLREGRGGSLAGMQSGIWFYIVTYILPVRVQVGGGYKGTVAVWGYKYPLFIYIWRELYFTLYTELPLIQVVWFFQVIISSIK